MEAMLNFVTKLTDVVKNHLEETKQCIGKEIVDATATKTGICVDRIKHSFGAKFSMLGHVYKENEMKEIEAIGEDILVCQGNNGIKFFLPASDIVAMGETVLLLNKTLGQPDVSDMGRKREEVFKKFFRTSESLEKLIPKLRTPVTRSKKKRSVLRLFH